jgi:hypothetical protein
VASRATTAADVARGRRHPGTAPSLCAQETWRHGRSVSPALILSGLAAAFGVNVALSFHVRCIGTWNIYSASARQRE